MPIIVVSSYAGKEKRIYKAGADAVIPKVLDLDAFANIVKNAVLHAKSLHETKAFTAPTKGLRLSPSLGRKIREIIASPSKQILLNLPMTKVRGF